MMTLSPLEANVLNESQKYYRVPVYQEGDEHIVFVGDNFKRRFTLDTLPDFLALKLSMIKAVAKPELLIDDMEDHNPSFAILLYSMLPYEGFETIGWQLSKRYMMVILTEDELEELKGDTRS
jgi:hypothetical protein